jgi:hypothetical protein
MSPLRRPAAAPPEPESLPVRIPGHDLAALEKERDGLQGRLAEVTLDRNNLIRESERLCKERDDLVVERDDLSTRSLPSLTSLTWEQVPDQGSPIGDDLATRSGGWWA